MRDVHDASVSALTLTAASGNPALTELGFFASQTALPKTLLALTAPDEVASVTGRLSADDEAWLEGASR